MVEIGKQRAMSSTEQLEVQQAAKIMTEPQKMNALRQEIRTLRDDLKAYRSTLASLPRNERRENAYAGLMHKLDNAERISNQRKFPLPYERAKKEVEAFRSEYGIFQVITTDEKATGSERSKAKDAINGLRNDVYSSLAEGATADAQSAFNYYNEIGRIYYDKLGSEQLIGEGPVGKLGQRLVPILNGQRKKVFKYVEQGNLAAARNASEDYSRMAYNGLNICKFEQVGLESVIGPERYAEHTKSLNYAMNDLKGGRIDSAQKTRIKVDDAVRKELREIGREMLLGSRIEDYSEFKREHPVPKMNELEKVRAALIRATKTVTASSKIARFIRRKKPR